VNSDARALLGDRSARQPARQRLQLTVSGVSAETLATLERIGGAAPTPDGGGWRVRLPGSPEVGSALDLVRGKAGTVESLVPVHASLEERFLAHVGRVTILD
jgi:hypothetical protein